MDMKTQSTDLVFRIREASPLVHNITNFVVMNSSANILLALGASPVMAHCEAEVAEMASLAHALVINIGTLDEQWVASMILAAQTGNKRGIPVVFDPVGAGATRLRTVMARKIMTEAGISVLRGNVSEILSLTSFDVKTRGVDSSLAMSGAVEDTVKNMAAEMDCIIAVSGEVDVITDGRRTFHAANGHPLMTRVTGIGCGLSAVTAAFCAVAEDDMLSATAAAHGFYALCGELAAGVSDRPGGFFTAFLDMLYATGRDEIHAGLKIQSS
jgi:hydroxyethylthiazole kinase